jgi:hypothetical protein
MADQPFVDAGCRHLLAPRAATTIISAAPREILKPNSKRG